MLERSFQGSGGIAVLLMVLLGLQASSPVVFGQSAAPPVTYAYTAYVDNQTTVNSCSAGEPVALNGTVQFSYQVTTDSAGVNHFAITAANNLTGVGQTTSTNYVASESDDYSSNGTDPSADLTVELKSDLRSQGSAPSLTLVQSLHLVVDTSGNISAQVVSNTTGCGN